MLTTGNRLPPFWIIDLGYGSGYLRVISPHQRIPLARKILLADDSVTAQNMGRKILADAGYEVITVNNGSAALKKIAEQKPDLIVLDVYMPGYSGLEVCQRLKEAPDTSRVPILLTVGKLEPFKPEEARRARADGFIVKPFEASELLSALSKLEDKIVPRAEAKPGRFARANAALDEGRYDKTVAIDEDSGWKNRISFPPKKKEKVEQEDGADPAIYNAVNKDLRTVVEHKLAEDPHETKPAETQEPKTQEPKAEEARVDLGALAPEGLPKDVTPEEIAALAAAAAQVKGKIAESSPEETVPVVAQTEHTAESKTELKAEAQVQGAPATELSSTATTASPAASFMEQKPEEQKPQEKSEEKIEAPTEAASVTAPSPADVMAAIAGLEANAGKSQESSRSESASYSSSDRTADEPVTMAAAAGAESFVATPRWTAVAVALAPEESAISLEHEMQKAYAAFAAADSGHARSSSTVQESQPVSTEPAVTTEMSAPVPAIPAPEATQASSEVASVATDAVTAASREPETVAASFVEQKSPAPVEPEPAPVEKAETNSATFETPQAVVTTIEETSASASADPETETPKLESARPEAPGAEIEAPKQLESEAPKQQEGDVQEGDIQKDEVQKEEDHAAVETVVAVAPQETFDAKTETPETIAPAAVNDAPAEQAPAGHASHEAVTAEPAAASLGDLAKKESEIAANTAAAWASWRRIRESGDPKAAPETSQKEADEPQDAAAMAVAAGAEKAPEDSTSEPDPEGIANIVDSVLADLRPKIYEEISRKMGKKK
jgi:CheY-like chemotaxis protein